MTTLAIRKANGGLSRSWLTEAFAGGDAVLARLAILLALLMAPTLAAMAVDTRTFNGINVWVKPFKFELSLTIYVMTLAFFVSFMDQRRREAWIYRLCVAALVTAATFNIAYIIFRASRAEGSHFNNATPIADALYGLMGVGALVQIGLAALIGVAILRSQEARTAPALRLSIGVGLIAATALTLICGGYMSSRGSHWVGGVQSDAGGIAFFGWSRTGGDLRIAHFLGTHTMHVVPLAGLAAAWLSEARAKAVVWLALAIWTALTLATFVQALAGIPLFPT